MREATEQIDAEQTIPKQRLPALGQRGGKVAGGRGGSGVEGQAIVHGSNLKVTRCAGLALDQIHGTPKG